MNKKEKREYISCLHLMENIELCHPEEIVRIGRVLSQCPDSLYKYKKIDRNVFDMLKNGYAYLSPVEKLDDPFDCLSDFDVSGILSPNSKTITDQFLRHIIKDTNNLSLDDRQLCLIKEYKSAFKPGDDFETDRVYEGLQKAGVPEDKIEDAIIQYKNFVNLSDTYGEAKAFERFAKILKDPGKTVGVCALSEIRDNKVMWSLYGKEYKGCCIEYCFKINNKPPRFLFPAIYSRKPNNSFAEKVFDSIYAELNRNVNSLFRFNPVVGAVGAIYELFCTKDIDWRFQREWRLVGDAQYHYHKVKIKSVYLGFNVAKTNEQKMIRYAKRYKFNLYKMKAPDGKKKIRFIGII